MKIGKLKTMCAAAALAVMLPASLYAEEADESKRTAADGTYLVEATTTVEGGEMTNLVKRAQQTLLRFKTDTTLGVPADAWETAECVVVFPTVNKAALLVGAKHGDGVATCRGPNREWSEIGFVDLIGGSFGAQLGAKTTAMVMFFLTDKAQQQLKSGELTLGADVNAVFGKADAEIEVNTDMNDIIAYGESAGLFAGSSLTGTVVKADDEELEEFYGEERTLRTVLTSYRIPDEPKIVGQFIMVLPRREGSVG